jgi:hypothetical protein
MNFVGSDVLGDVVQMVISHSDATDGIFAATARGTNDYYTLSHFSTVNAGFRETLPEPNPYGNFGRPIFVPSYAVEIQDQIILMQVNPSPIQRVIAAVANTCPQLAATFPTTAIYQFISLPTPTFATTDPSYGTLALTQAASNSYNLTFDTFQNDGTPIPSTTFMGVSCDANLQVLSFTGAPGNPVTVAISAAGALLIDNGTGVPAMGVRQPSGNLSSTPILGGQYLGVVYAPTANVGDGSVPIVSGPVGFGPGFSTSITGGAYSNIDSDAFSSHAVDEVITLGAYQISPGLFTGGTLVIPGTATMSNFNVVVGQVNGKFVLFGLSSVPSQPYGVLLLQQ